MLDKDDQLFQAFVAGFDASVEGFNGEYVGRRYNSAQVLEDRLRVNFEEWLEEVEGNK